MVNDKVVQKAGSGKILSIVIPTYNMEKYLPACLDSVTDELVSDRLEVIVVNDGSTDVTWILIVGVNGKPIYCVLQC